MSFKVSSEKTTSWAVSGVPSWNVSLRPQQEGVGQPVVGDAHARAASPYMASGSSPERTIMVAKVSSMPCAASPLRM